MANLKIHFLKLVNLFEGHTPIFPTLRFDIDGNHTQFTIKKVLGYPYLYAGLFVVIFIFPFLWMIPSNFKSARFWLVELFLMGTTWGVFHFLVASRRLTVITIDKTIILERRNIFKKTIGKPLWIQFREIQKLTAEPKSKTINKFGQKVVYQHIYVLYKDEKRFLMALPSNFQQVDADKTFKRCLEAIFKDG